ncbi:hypothetical protein J9317_06415 [Metabacillus sp. KIGAM252]|uniref:Competence protein CoiA n=1 Tax=Metabacillus flavus TaxID=2823519 RepID=A0ABS5LCN1_9BACI|nr:hypothetical protein [Metabacillus flavus]
MLTSLTESGAFSLLSRVYSFEELDQLRTTESFYCPACRQSLELKLGKVKRYHFAHRKKTACHFEAEPESERHLLGKEQLFNRLRQEGKAEVEPYLPAIRQRPDIMLTINKKKYAIEYQCSSIPHELAIRRSKGYKSLGIEPVWILGSNQLQRTGASEYRLNAFHWLFAKNFSYSSLPYLLFYCPENKQLLRLTRFFPFSKQIFHAKAEVIELSMDSLTPHKFSAPNGYPVSWLQSKVLRFRKYPPSKQITSLQKVLYLKKRLPISLIPAIVFMPSHFDFAIETEPYVWKTRLLLWVEARTFFSKEEVLRYFSFLEMEGHITRRNLQTINPSPEEILYEWGTMLIKAGFLTSMEKNNIYTHAPIKWSANIADVLQEDCEFFRLISGLEHNL